MNKLRLKTTCSLFLTSSCNVQPGECWVCSQPNMTGQNLWMNHQLVNWLPGFGEKSLSHTFFPREEWPYLSQPDFLYAYRLYRWQNQMRKVYKNWVQLLRTLGSWLRSSENVLQNCPCSSFSPTPACSDSIHPTGGGHYFFHPGIPLEQHYMVELFPWDNLVEKWWLPVTWSCSCQ